MLIEAGLDLYQHRYLLAVLGGLGQVLDHRGAGGDAVEGHLDSQHPLVVGCLMDKIDDCREGVVGMVQQEILLADGGKHIAAVLVQLGHLQLQAMEAGKGLIAQILMACYRPGQLLQERQVDGAVDAVDHCLRYLQDVDEMLRQGLVHGVLHFQPHHGAMLALP